LFLKFKNKFPTIKQLPYNNKYFQITEKYQSPNLENYLAKVKLCKIVESSKYEVTANL